MPDIVVMFFLLGLFAGIVRSDLSIPKAVYEILSLLLMLTIGLKGGMALHGNLSWSLIPSLGGVMLIGAAIPLLLFPLLVKVVRLNFADSASIAAHYGSVSAGTFAVALAYADSHGLTVDAEITLYLVLMELPAIIVGLLLFRQFSKGEHNVSIKAMWHEALTNKGVILLVGGVLIGFMYGPQQGAAVTDLLMGGFKAVLALFLLEMGLVASQTLRPFPLHQWRMMLFALIAPLCLSLVGIGAGIALGLSHGSAIVLASLTASASYIAAPAAVKGAIPEANIGLAMLASLGITFPFNVTIGIGLYDQIIQWLM
ncbi:sodium-dependent bicarbonate transport family permease [Thaumasiovibrio subtropicus]|uniref:sodium-dependent bicarbonate transport family permease n=1 Tax=Thaumasiovibrio subtropicus TaxID=1891207 RepID=UPI000B34D423|nr:sodium-dependent bicarbonate transport family permease [Thaumasiovibrio subtropicus]